MLLRFFILLRSQTAILVAFLIFSSVSLGFAASFTGKVVRVLDGDTIEVLHNTKPERIRLHGIDAPESGQAFGNRAKQFVLNIAAQEIVTVETRDSDRYGRTVAEIFLPDGRSLNRELVKEGYAWWYRQYSRDATLGVLEAEAKAAKRGLWADPNPVPPWEWRSGSRNQNKRIAERSTPGEAVSQKPYHGNTSSRVFHQSTCKHYNCKNCTEVLSTREKAIRKGFKPCGECKP